MGLFLFIWAQLHSKLMEITAKEKVTDVFDMQNSLNQSGSSVFTSDV